MQVNASQNESWLSVTHQGTTSIPPTHHTSNPPSAQNDASPSGRATTSLQPTSSSIQTWKQRGEWHMQRKELDLAIDAWTKALEDAEKRNSSSDIAETLKYIADVFLEKDQLTMAAKILNGALAIYQKQTPQIGGVDHTMAIKSIFARLIEIERRFLEKQCEIKKQSSQTTDPGIYAERRVKLQKLRQTMGLQSNQSCEPKKILEEFSDGISAFLKEMLDHGFAILGKPPCEFAFIGLGSLGRKEMSPFSDLEFAVLVQNNTPNHLSWFRNLVNWLELQVICLGETDIKILEHGHLSPVPRGFSFDDGGNTPLGKQSYIELLNTPQELAQLQNERFYEEDLILSNVLRSAVLLVGNESLLQGYTETMHTILDAKIKKRSVTIRQQRAVNILQGHLVEFEPQINKKKEENPVFNIKLELYRLPSFLIAGLADYFGIEKQNTWERIDALIGIKIIGEVGAKNLKDALSKVMSLRLRCHLHYGRECDEAYHPAMQRKMDEQGLKEKSFLLSDDDIKTVIEIYSVLLPLYQAFLQVCTKEKNDFRKLAKYTFHDSDLREQGVAYEKLSLFESAKKCYQQAIALDPDNFHAHINLANLLTRLSDPEADEYVKKGVAAAAKTGDKEGIIRSLKLRGKVCTQKGKYEEALQCYTELYSYAKKTYGLEDRDVAAALNFLGETSQLLGKNKEAMKYFKEALKINEKIYGIGHPEAAVNLSNMGAVYYYLEEHIKSIDCFEQALQIEKKAFGKIHEKVAVRFNNLGAAFVRLEDYQKGMQYYEQALQIDKTLFGDDHPNVAVDSFNIGVALRKSGNAQKAMEYLQESLNIYKKQYGPEHQKVAESLKSIGTTHSHLGNHKEAVENLTAALAINRKVLRNTHPELGINLNNLGQAYLKLGDQQEAKKAFEEALTILTQAYGPSHKFTMGVQQNLEMI